MPPRGTGRARCAPGRGPNGKVDRSVASVQHPYDLRMVERARFENRSEKRDTVRMAMGNYKDVHFAGSLTLHSAFGCLPAKLAAEPGPCQIPFAHHGSRRDSHHFSRLLDAQSAEELQFHDFPLA